MTGKSPGGRQGREKFERPAFSVSRGSPPAISSVTSAPSGSLRVMVVERVRRRGHQTFALAGRIRRFQDLDIEIGGGETRAIRPPAEIRTLDRIGIVLRFSTTA